MEHGPFVSDRNHNKRLTTAKRRWLAEIRAVPSALLLYMLYAEIPLVCLENTHNQRHTLSESPFIVIVSMVCSATPSLFLILSEGKESIKADPYIMFSLILALVDNRRA